MGGYPEGGCRTLYRVYVTYYYYSPFHLTYKEG